MPGTANEQKKLNVRDCGLLDYEAAYRLQRECVEQVLQGGAPVLLLCEHPAVLTLGRLASQQHILYSKEELAGRGVSVLAVDRGGEVTLHSPGQLVVYPILDLTRHGKDLRAYLSTLEQVAIDLLKEFDILADRFPGRTGAWVGEQKIVSIGVGVRKWVSFHGLGINVNTDLELFRLIRPCGLDVQMTTIAQLKGHAVDMGAVKAAVMRIFARTFGYLLEE